MALCMFPKVNNLGLADVPDVVGYNRYFGWYYGNLSDLGPFLDEEHENYPNRIIMISEYGAGSDIKIHTDKPKKFDFSEEYQCRFHESYLEQINSRHYLAGACIWNQFDFGDEVKGNTIPHVNQKGMLTMDRKEKDVFYFYKSQWSDEPVLYIVSHHWQVHRASETKGVVVYTNCDSVELFLNNKSQGNQINGFEWKVKLAKGINELKAIGMKDSTEIMDNIVINYIESTKN
jgi:beta-galactosidase